MRVLPTGKVQVVTGTTPHGQGHETSWSMIVADQLGVGPDDVEVLHSDTAIAPLGLDTYGSRSLAVGGVAIVPGARQGDRQGPARSPPTSWRRPRTTSSSSAARSRCGARPTTTMPLAAIAFEAFTAHNLPDGMEPNLEAQRHLRPAQLLVPVRHPHLRGRGRRGDRRTSTSCKYVAVDDCGNQINPLIVDGQVHGGIVQGVAQALFEEAVYDDDGNLQTSHAGRLPRAVGRATSRRSRLDHTVTPSPTNPLGVKGIGEAGTIGAAPAVINAIVDALSPLGVTDVAMPAHPQTGLGRHPAASERRRRPVIPAAFDYVRADSADEAIALHRRARRRRQVPRRRPLAAAADEAAPGPRRRCSSTSAGCADLSYIRDAGDHVAIGALTRHRDLETSDAARRARAAAAATPPARSATRRCATAARIGGSIAHADPASDLPGGRCWRSARDRRGAGPERRPARSRPPTSSPASSRSALAADELLTEIRVPEDGRAPAGRFQKFNRRAQDWAIVGVRRACTARATRVGLVNMGSTPLRRHRCRAGARRRRLGRRRGRPRGRRHRAAHRPQRRRRVPPPPGAGPRAPGPRGGGRNAVKGRSRPLERLT